MKDKKLIVPSGKNIRLSDYDPAYTGEFLDKKSAQKKLEKDIEKLFSLQEKLYACGRYAVLVILQAMDAAGKDSVIKHVMSGLNPQGCRVVSFKAPSAEELAHDFLWRCVKELPLRGQIGIFNRSYYEELLIVRVHPEFLENQKLPDGIKQKNIWEGRYASINHFEEHLVHNGVRVLKFFLHVSREEQKQRFLERIEKPQKHWKFSSQDIEERKFWKDYMQAYENMLNNTSTPWAPWYVIPADHKWFTQVAIGSILVDQISTLNLHFPKLSPEKMKELSLARKLLMGKDLS